MSRAHRPAHARGAGLARLLVAGAAAGGLTLGLLAPGPAAWGGERVSEVFTVPADGDVPVSGRGYGHGRGMSQYGALGAARQGLGFKQILAHYYPGTSLGEVRGPIRVLITADTDDDVRVLPVTGLRVREVASGASYVLPTPEGATVWRLRTVSGGTVLDWYDGRWNVHRPGGKALSGVAEFHRDGPLTLKVAGSDRPYRGALRLDAGDTVNVLPLDDYIKGVVPREMPATWEPAAVQAQAVAARTYASWERADHPTRHYQTCDTTSCQVYGGMASEHPRSNAAVDATEGRILTYDGRPAFTQFGSSSGGYTVAGSMPYLVAKADRYDGHAGNPVHTWSTKLTAKAIQRAWPSLGSLQRITVTQRDGKGEWAGRVESMTLTGSRGKVTVTGSTFRSTFGLRSSWFRIGSAAAPKPSPTPTPTPKPSPAPAESPITARWKAIGGMKSVVRGPRSAEFSVADGRARRYERGRIYHKAGVGARELHGKVVKAYVRRGGAKSRLGFPTSTQRSFSRGVYATFEHGVLRVYRSGKVTVSYRG